MIQIFMYITHPTLPDAEATGSTFPQTVSTYCPQAHHKTVSIYIIRLAKIIS
jgi:hypothetical protein